MKAEREIKKGGWEAFADQEGKKKKKRKKGRTGEKKKCMCVFRNMGIFLADLKLRQRV